MGVESHLSGALTLYRITAPFYGSTGCFACRMKQRCTRHTITKVGRGTTTYAWPARCGTLNVIFAVGAYMLIVIYAS